MVVNNEIASHLSQADVRHYAYALKDEALAWLRT